MSALHIRTLKVFSLLSVFFVVLCVLYWAGREIGFRQKNMEAAEREALQPGDRVLSMAENDILSAAYFAPQTTITAQRAAPGNRFSVLITFTDGSAPRHCVVPSDLNGLLPLLSGLTAKDPASVPGEDVHEPQPALLDVWGKTIRWQLLQEPGRDIFQIRHAQGQTSMYQYRGAGVAAELNVPDGFTDALHNLCP